MDFEGQPVAFPQVAAYYEGIAKAPTFDSEHRSNRWTAELVDVSRLRVCHDDFRSIPLAKGRLFSEIVADHREQIAEGDFPQAERITSVAEVDLPAIWVLRDATGEIYVADGQLRTLNAIWNGISFLPAFVFDEGSNREVVDAD